MSGFPFVTHPKSLERHIDTLRKNIFWGKIYRNQIRRTNRCMSNKGKYKTLSGKHADSNKQVILETWDIQEQKLKTSHLGLPDFLNRHFTIKKTTGENRSD